MQAKISILIPVYNVEKTLDACLDSAINQTLKEIEIICVDDGSADHSKEILEHYCALDSRIIPIFHKQNEGLYMARKTGVAAASGKYIMFLDSDDTLSLNACEIAFQMIEKHRVDIFQFSASINTINAPLNVKYLSLIQSILIPCGERLEGRDVFLSCFVDNRKYYFTLWNKIYNTDLCKRAYSTIENFRLTVAEDLLLYFIISFLANSYYGAETECLYHYNLGSGICGGTYHQLSEGQFHDFCRTAQVVPHLQEFLLKQNSRDKYDQALNRINHELFTDCLNKFLLMGAPRKWEDLFVRYWFHDDKRLFQSFMIRENSIHEFQRSLSLKLGLFLTWIPRKFLSFITGKTY